MSSSDCGPGGGAFTYTGLRIGSIFIVLVGSSFGALFPIVAARSKHIHIPKRTFEFVKYFGSGVIIATAFIHLLSPAITELGSSCLDPAWSVYPYALALAMLSLFCIFIVELVAFRWGMAKLSALGLVDSGAAHGHVFGEHSCHGAGLQDTPPVKLDPETAHPRSITDESVLAQIIGVFILEFGVLLHSLLIGLTLAVDPGFMTLFVVIIFHQTFEGLGIGSRLAQLRLAPQHNYIPYAAGGLYAITTPLGIAVGLGIRSTYNPGSTTASIVSGIMDSISAGILLYTGLVELLAHEFIFNKEMTHASNGKVVYAVVCMLFGTGIMALLGRWA